MAKLTYHGTELDRFDHMYNHTWATERGVELAAYQDWWDRALDDRFDALQDTVDGVLEVGNVLNHYPVLSFPHTVVDRYETDLSFDHGFPVQNRDVFDILGTFDLIIAISTLEHVRYDEPDIDREPAGSFQALLHLLHQLAPGGRMFVTVPTGHNPDLDEELDHLVNDPFLAALAPERACTMLRVPDEGGESTWVQTPELEFHPYGVTTKWAEAVWIGEWVR